MNQCVICGGGAEGGQTSSKKDGFDFACANCGSYFISGTAHTCIGRLDQKACSILSAAVWMGQNDNNPFEIYSSHLDEAEKAQSLNPTEQLEKLILYLGYVQSDSPGKEIHIHATNLRAKLGAITENDVFFILKAAKEKGLLNYTESNLYFNVHLSFEGWSKYRELLSGSTLTRTAFMALSFKNDAVAKIVDKIFKPAVAETGFILKRLDDDAPAGIMDNRLRVEIRMSRFLVADMTDENSGVYWESGYAEGLGKPVIFTCEQSYFDANKTHFDTNHQHTVLWTSNDPEKAANDLMSTIRATLPFEAKMPRD